jgi:hypothetical protein
MSINRCDPSLLGLVVSQEPAAGSALARNGMVTLHLAATGDASATDEGTPVEPTTGSVEVGGAIEEVPSHSRSDPTASHDTRRRWLMRKRGAE